MNKSITSLSGIGEKKAELFSKLGINTIYDLLMYFPRAYEDRSKITTIYEAKNSMETVCIRATVFSSEPTKHYPNKITMNSFVLTDETGKISAVYFNNRFIGNSLKLGHTYVFFGKVTKHRNYFVLENPIFEEEGKNKLMGKIVPLYPLVSGVSQKLIQNAMIEASAYIESFTETLPTGIRLKYGLCTIKYALSNIHFPVSMQAFETAKKRLAFDELFVLSLSLLRLKHKKKQHTAYVFDANKYKKDFEKLLPFTLTDSQEEVIAELSHDFASGFPSSRLICGDVGSGKTAVAAFCMYGAAKSGYQAAIMAPTEILAAQHYNLLNKLFGKEFCVCLLSGSMKASEKKQTYEMIESGKADIIVGTHALIQKDVHFKNLALVITDEQHRFGVEQRDNLSSKSENPHIVVMSATPIPRTLALTLYGDLDISAINALPSGRKKIKTYCVTDEMRERIYNFIRKQVSLSHQVYIVCPLVEESEKSGRQLKNVIQYAKKLNEKIFPDLTVALLHGKMKQADKDKVMLDFKDGKTDILVSTTVIEVGIDVANATLMVIENAERFGLSQLHQLRGRVGRGNFESFCVLFCNSNDKITRQRMQIMCESTDGFYISEKDLALRGPGEFFGVRQHGIPKMRIADIAADIRLLNDSRCAAEEILLHDETLNSYKELKELSDKLTDRIAI